VRTPSALCDEWVLVIGRMSLLEFLQFMKTVAGQDPNDCRDEQIQVWREANERLREMEEAEAGMAAKPDEVAMSPEDVEFAEACFRQAPAERAFKYTPRQWSLVELDRLIVFQHFINLGFVSEIDRNLEDTLTNRELISIAMGVGANRPQIHFRRLGRNSFSFTCASEEFCLLEPTLLDSTTFQSLEAAEVAAVIGVPVGFGTNIISAVRTNDRLVLINGTHRAYALRRRGATHVPCLVLDASRAGDLDLLTGETQHQFVPYLKLARPPLFKDYFDDCLRRLLPIPRSYPLLEIQITVQRHRAPAF
jgi:hypothetical protein